MNAATKQESTPPQRYWQLRAQGGFTMIELLVALLILGMSVAGIAAASITGGKSSQIAEQTARMNVLITAFGEAIKALPYEECGSAVSYQVKFDARENELPAEVLHLRDSLDATMQVTSVVHEGDSNCPGEDAGAQTIGLKVAVDTREVERTIVKRDPEPANEPIDFDFDTVPRHNPGDITVVWGLEATGSTDIAIYEWWCDPVGAGWWAPNSWDPQTDSSPPSLPSTLPIPDDPPEGVVPQYYQTFERDDPEVECQYAAPSTSDVKQWVALRVTQPNGRTAVKIKPFYLDPTIEVPTPPQIAIVSVEQRIVGSPDVKLCVLGDACQSRRPEPVEFRAERTDVVPGQREIVRWRWEFGDGSVSECTRRQDPTGNSCWVRTHVYQGGSASGFPARLTVTDSVGHQSSPTSRLVVVEGPPVVLPQINLSTTLDAYSHGWVAPSWVDFDASQSKADGKAPGVDLKFDWDFGDNKPGSVVLDGGPTISYRYSEGAPNNSPFQVRLTVTHIDHLHGGIEVKAYHTIEIPVYNLQPPLNPRIADGKPYTVHWPWDPPMLRPGWVDLFFVHPPHSPGDTTHYKVTVKRAGSLCNLITNGSNEETVIFAANRSNPNGTQIYRWTPLNLCGWSDNFTFTFQTRRTWTDRDGITHVDWSDPVDLLFPGFP